METYRRVMYSPSAVNLAVVEEVPDSEIVEARKLKWHPCAMCRKRFRDNSALQRHLADIHNINVVWH